ncbi:MAG TPA: histidinol dehydrogenase, partial [Cyclobacteriaceae bacterium]|nr:histidinol dehydrogenase [Cyclobacteriaceae bacterium]
MQIFRNPLPDTWPAICQRPQIESEFLENSVKNILARVQRAGDEALREFTRQFDQATLTKLQLSQTEIDTAVQSVPAALKTAIQTAASNIEKFHAAQKQTVARVVTMPGVTCWRKPVAIQKVGLYIP